MPNDAKYCPLHQSFFNEQDEIDDEEGDYDEEDDGDDEGGDDYEDEDDQGEDEECDGRDHTEEGGDSNPNINGLIKGKITGKTDKQNLRRCDCYIRFSDSDASSNHNEKPKKSVRFDDRVYEVVFFAARLYDRRSFVKYHSSTRHHPPMNQQNSNKSKKNRNNSTSKPAQSDGSTGTDKHTCRQTKSQRAKQSKKDKKKRRLSKSNESSDDQGYCSSIHSFSD